MVASIRSEIVNLGGEVRFSNKLVNVKTDNGEICGAVVESDSGEYVIETNNIVLAIGHSKRYFSYAPKSQYSNGAKEFFSRRENRTFSRNDK